MAWKKVKIGELIIESKEVVGNIDVENYGVNNKTGIELSVRRTSEDTSSYKIIKHNYFAYNPYRVNVGSIGLFDGNIGAVSPAYVVFHVDETKILPQLFFSFLKSSKGLFEINKHTTGTVRKSLGINNLGKIEINLPGIDEQRLFLNKINSIEKEIKELEELGATNKDLIKKLRQSILQEAIEGKLTEEWRKSEEGRNAEPASELIKRIKEEKEKMIKEGKLKKTKENGNISKGEYKYSYPNNWILGKMVDFGFVTKLAGFEYTKYIKLNDKGEVPVIRAQNVKMNRIDETNLKYIDKKISDLLFRCSLSKESILMTFIGAGIGDVAIFNKRERWHLAPNVAKVELFNNYNKNLDIKYILYFLMSEIGRNEIFKYSKSTAQPSLSMSTIRQIIIPIPSFQEQQKIVEKVDELMAFCDEIEKEINENKDSSESLMEAVLGEIFKNE